MSLIKPFRALKLPSRAIDVVLAFITRPLHKLALAKAFDSPLAVFPLFRDSFDVRTFASEFLVSHPDWAREDVEAVLRRLEQEVAPHGLLGWIAALVQLGNIDIDFYNGEPVVPLDCAASWQVLSSVVEPDVIIAYVLARKGLAARVFDLEEGWKTVTRIADRDLEVLLFDGITDLHVHLGGTRNANVTWSRMLLDEFRLEHLPRFDPTAGWRRGADQAVIDLIEAERTCITRVQHALQGSGRSLGWMQRLTILTTRGRPRGIDAIKSSDPRERRARRYHDVSFLQRRMLVDLLELLLRENEPGRKPPPGTVYSPRYEEAERAVAAFVVAKNAFLEGQQQPLDGNPGLGAFQGYFSANQPRIHPRRNELRWTRSARLDAAVEYSPFAFFLCQSVPPLKYCELRLGPLDTVGDYIKLFQSWGCVEEHFGIPDDEARKMFRFAIHFKRGGDPWHRSPKAGSSRLPDAVIQQSRYDRAATILHQFRTSPTPKARKYASRIVRIDLAGPERAGIVDRAAFHMRLLRGNVDDLNLLRSAAVGEGALCREAHAGWLTLASRPSFVQVGLGSPRLGITCHAGEDFGHPIEGLYAIDRAIEALQLGSGDTIGHGLALAADVCAFDKGRGRTTLMEQGQLFDCMLWLRNRILELRLDALDQCLPRLDGWLGRMFQEIYRYQIPLPQPDLVEELFRLRAGPMPAREPAKHSLVHRLHYRETWDDTCVAARRREVRLPYDEELMDLVRPAIERMQDGMITKLEERGIVVELNPSSNMRISGARPSEEMPYLPLLLRTPRMVPATINSDDPGVFATRIENEYAYVMQALRASGIGRTEVLSKVETLRRMGLRQAK